MFGDIQEAWAASASPAVIAYIITCIYELAHDLFTYSGRSLSQTDPPLKMQPLAICTPPTPRNLPVVLKKTNIANSN